MWRTNLQVALVVLGTIGVYTYIANAIPQIESDVPTELSFSGEVTPEQLVQAGSELYHGAGGCTACHGLGTRAPHLQADEGGTGLIGARCAARVPGQDCKTYLHNSLVAPNTYVVAGYDPIMQDVSRTLSDAQIWSLVAYLESLGGEVTVTSADLAPAAATGAAPAAGAAPVVASLDPQEIMEATGCMACHALAGQGGALGPPFDGIGARLAPDALRRGILDPAAEIAPGFEALAGLMPATFGDQLTAAQLEALVAYLAGLR